MLILLALLRTAAAGALDDCPEQPKNGEAMGLWACPNEGIAAADALVSEDGTRRFDPYIAAVHAQAVEPFTAETYDLGGRTVEVQRTVTATQDGERRDLFMVLDQPRTELARLILCVATSSQADCPGRLKAVLQDGLPGRTQTVGGLTLRAPDGCGQQIQSDYVAFACFEEGDLRAMKTRSLLDDPPDKAEARLATAMEAGGAKGRSVRCRIGGQPASCLLIQAPAPGVGRAWLGTIPGQEWLYSCAQPARRGLDPLCAQVFDLGKGGK